MRLVLRQTLRAAWERRQEPHARAQCPVIPYLCPSRRSQGATLPAIPLPRRHEERDWKFPLACRNIGRCTLNSKAAPPGYDSRVVRSLGPREVGVAVKTAALREHFSLEFHRTGLLARTLVVSQQIPLPRDKVFAFFEDPRNLFEITPVWLDFRMVDPLECAVAEGAEFDYTIRWFGVRLRWRSRIIDYHPPLGFTDVQTRGPFGRWEHLHTFSPHGRDTRMHDRIAFRLPLAAAPVEPLIRRHLAEIFCYRAERIAQWAAGTMERRLSEGTPSD